jgi:hypothetical protein
MKTHDVNSVTGILFFIAGVPFCGGFCFHTFFDLQAL